MRAPRRLRYGRILALCATAALLVGCTADDFHDLAEGDCTRGDPQLEGELERIDCDDFDSTSPEHHRVTQVVEGDPEADCPLGSTGYEDRDRLVCFSR